MGCKGICVFQGPKLLAPGVFIHLNTQIWTSASAIFRYYQRQIHEDLHAVAWAHVSNVVEVGGVGDQLGSHFRIPQHLPIEQKGNNVETQECSSVRNVHLKPPYLLCCSRSSSGTLKRNFLLLRVLTISFLLLSEVSGMARSQPSVKTQCE